MPENSIIIDLTIFGATPSGIASAVTAGRKGLKVALISSNDQLGGILTNGLGAMDQLYNGFRSPLNKEIKENIIDFYINKYGENSEQVKVCKGFDNGVDGVNRLTFEPHVAQIVLNNIVENNKQIKIFKSFIPNNIIIENNQIKSLEIKSIINKEKLKLKSKTYVDASYEGDLAALSGVPYRVGRESNKEFNEPHAGRIFSTHGFGAFPLEASEGGLNLDTFPVTSQLIFSGSTGEGDNAIQAFTYRVCLTSDPDLMISIEKPKDYKRETYLGVIESEKDSRKKRHYLKSQLVVNDINNYKIKGARLPNNKISWNEGNLPEINHPYPEGDMDTRLLISKLHREHALGLLFFLQNDEEVPKNIRESCKKWGLAKDEFMDNENFPKEMYVREARRIVGKYIFTEQDASLSSNFERTPIHKDSIGIADWPMDSHECTMNRQPGSLYDGKILLSEKTRPSQIPYRCLLPKGIDNLMVTVCLSATHVGFGTIRVEPTLIQLGEVAGFASLLSKEQDTNVAQLETDYLQTQLVENGVEISFFNDVDIDNLNNQSISIHFLCSKGFFTDYNARKDHPLSKSVAENWVKGYSEFLDKNFDPNTLANKIYKSKQDEDSSITNSEFVEMIKAASNKSNLNFKLSNQIQLNDEIITIGQAAEIIFLSYKDNLQKI